MSASLNRLRATFDDPLFTRTAHGVAPTPRALALAEQVERVLADLQRLLEPDDRFDPARSQRIFRITGTDGASHLMLPTLVRELSAAGSRVRICWEGSPLATMPERLSRGEYDIAVVARLEPPRDVDATMLYQDHYVFVARAGHPALTQGATLDLFCALPQAFFGYGASALDDRIDALLAREGRHRLATVALTSFAQIVDLLLQTDHTAVMPWRVAQLYGDRLAVHPMPIALPDYQLFVCSDRRAAEDVGIQWLKQALLRIGAAPSPEPAP